MANDKTIVDDSSMDMDYEPYEPPKQKRSPMGVFKNALERITNPFNNQYGEDEREVDLKEAMSPQQYADYLEEQKKAWEPDSKEDEALDVPEIETEVVDLPEEDENEKELVVEHTDENEPIEQPIEPPPTETPTSPLTENDIDTNQDMLDATQVDKALGKTEEQPQEENGDKTLTPNEKEEEDMNELRALAQDDLEGFRYDKNMDKWTPKQKQDAIKSFLEKRKAEQKEEPIEEEPIKEEPPKVMTDEEALEEARMLAQDDLEGFNIKGADWSKLTTKEKGDIIDRFLNKNKTNDEITNIDEDTTNNYEAYKRYPTGLRLFEDTMQGASNVLDRVERASNENLAGGTSINNMVNKTAIPHYDYRRFFGQ